MTADGGGRPAGERCGHSESPRPAGRGRAAARRPRAQTRFGNRAVSRALGGERGLLRNRNRVVDQRFDAVRLQVRLHRVARVAAHREQVIDVPGVRFRRDDDGVDVRERAAIVRPRARGDAPSTRAAAAGAREGSPPGSRRAASSRRTPRGGSDPSGRRCAAAGRAPRAPRRRWSARRRHRARRGSSSGRSCRPPPLPKLPTGLAGARGQMRLAAVLDDRADRAVRRRAAIAGMSAGWP